MNDKYGKLNVFLIIIVIVVIAIILFGIASYIKGQGYNEIINFREQRACTDLKELLKNEIDTCVSNCTNNINNIIKYYKTPYLNIHFCYKDYTYAATIEDANKCKNDNIILKFVKDAEVFEC